MQLLVAVAAAAASLTAVAWEVRAARKQGREALRAEQFATSFFDMYRGWCENRRAQLEPVNLDLLRTSSAAFYTAALRLTVLGGDDTIDALHEFMANGLTFSGEDDPALIAFWKLHHQVVSDLGFRQPLAASRLTEMFNPRRNDTPTIVLGNVEQPRSLADIRMWRLPRTERNIAPH